MPLLSLHVKVLFFFGDNKKSQEKRDTCDCRTYKEDGTVRVNPHDAKGDG